MSTPPQLLRCIDWIQSLLPCASDTDFPESSEAWLYPSEAGYRIGVHLDDATQALTVMAFKPGADGEQPQGFEPLTSARGEGNSQRQIVPFYFDHRFYGARIPLTGAMFLCLQLKADELDGETYPRALKEWFETAADWMQ